MFQPELFGAGNHTKYLGYQKDRAIHHFAELLAKITLLQSVLTENVFQLSPKFNRSNKSGESAYQQIIN